MSEYLPGSSQDTTIFQNSWKDSEYWPSAIEAPAEVVELVKPIAQAMLSPREEYDRFWNERKTQSEQWNMKNFHGGYRHGTYFSNGVGQKRG